MPTYQYACTNPDCGNNFEQFQAFTDPALTACPVCDQRVRKVYGSVGVVFKGSGFYRTDSRESKKSDAVASSDSAKSTGDGATKGTSSDSGKSGDSSKPAAASNGSAAKSGGSSNGSSSGGSATASGPKAAAAS
ncbi:MAG: hypothetical protein QOK10_1308 [Pseudonocardiales bacterium]|jgi:putative FmdB family regulatory protein|nr:hypothetical protein [Pseudonocardiales bacterium]